MVRRRGLRIGVSLRDKTKGEGQVKEEKAIERSVFYVNEV